MFKLFAFYNLESSILAHHGKKADRIKYIERLRQQTEEEVQEEEDIDQQFKELNFG